jgi:MFS family permease
MNLGQLLGPLVGGALYQSGGFYLPFLTMGALQATMGLVSMVALKEIPGKIMFWNLHNLVWFNEHLHYFINLQVIKHTKLV